MSDDFLLHLYKGEEALREGSLDDAKDYLEQAFRLKPDHEQTLSLLGLAYYRLGHYYRVSQVYRRLVNLNPGDPVLRLNHALGLIKLDRLDEAEKELEACLELSPDNARAHSLLGLLCSRTSRYEEAARHFRAAGQQDMVKEVESRAQKEKNGGIGLVKELDVDDVDGSSEPVVGYKEAGGGTWGWRDEDRVAAEMKVNPATVEPPVGNPEEAPFVEILPLQGEEGNNSKSDEKDENNENDGIQGDAGQENIAVNPDGVEAGFELAGISRQSGAELEQFENSDEQLEEQFDAAKRQDIKREDATFSNDVLEPVDGSQDISRTELQGAKIFRTVKPGVLLVSLLKDRPGDESRSVYLRRSKIIALWGKVDLKEEMARKRGAKLDHVLGGNRPLVRAEGNGMVLASVSQSRILLHEVHNKALYLREELILGFDSGFAFEGGSLSGKGIAPDLPLLTLSGTGTAAIADIGLVWANVSNDRDVTVRWDRLAGWDGDLIPTVINLSIDDMKPVPAVLFSGTGRVLVCIEGG
ncbi:MAG: tetratricopeptide repeat protein [Deltaproteobacteria bacterium]|nr:tetratricopeptide repeat protein [Deltaproteobacteria bacterium]